jgi:hypothetical protein
MEKYTYVTAACISKCTPTWDQISTGAMDLQEVYSTNDSHGMQSLARHDCLPRLVDASLCPDGAELHMLRSWRERLGDERQEAEDWLGFSLQRLQRRWVSPGGRGLDDQKLFEVPIDSQEFRHVEATFRAPPREDAALPGGPQEAWDRVKVVAVHRVENGRSLERSERPYCASVRKSVEDQGMAFEPGTHTRWTFHGADAGSTESIINDPMSGFKPLAATGFGGSPWGSGLYFARDARHIAMGGHCGAPATDGTRCMLMCLVTTGAPCLGDPKHIGVLPMRSAPHRYHSSVDSLSSPETHVLQHHGAAHAAYLISFA